MNLDELAQETSVISNDQASIEVGGVYYFDSLTGKLLGQTGNDDTMRMADSSSYYTYKNQGNYAVMRSQYSQNASFSYRKGVRMMRDGLMELLGY